jgi:hypothetical protein
MTHHLRLVAVVAVLTALAQCAPVPEIDALRARAEAGDAEAQYSLGVNYTWDFDGITSANGEAVPDVPVDDVEAARWFRLAADQGHVRAQTNLANRYENGRGVPQDYVQAHMWYNLVASRRTGGFSDSAVEARDKVGRRITPTQIAEAQRLATEWDAAHPREP